MFGYRTTICLKVIGLITGESLDHIKNNADRYVIFDTLYKNNVDSMLNKRIRENTLKEDITDSVYTHIEIVDDISEEDYKMMQDSEEKYLMKRYHDTFNDCSGIWYEEDSLKIRWCNDYCVENPLQYFDEEEEFFTYDVLEGVEEYLDFSIPEDIKIRILNQQEEWEKCYDNTPPEDPDDINIRVLRDTALLILKDLKNILPNNVEIILFDETSQKDLIL